MGDWRSLGMRAVCARRSWRLIGSIEFLYGFLVEAAWPFWALATYQALYKTNNCSCGDSEISIPRQHPIGKSLAQFTRNTMHMFGIAVFTWGRVGSKVSCHPSSDRWPPFLASYSNQHPCIVVSWRDQSLVGLCVV